MNKRRDGMEETSTVTVEGPATLANLVDGLQRPAVEVLARRQLGEKCTYASCFNQVTFSYSQGILILEGRLPSFYLKQVLQTHLRDLEGVTRIDNRVDVVSPTGLSSVRPK